jgi:hypothetical protein
MSIDDRVQAYASSDAPLHPAYSTKVQDACSRSIVKRFAISVVAANAVAAGVWYDCGVENPLAIAGAHLGASVTGLAAGAAWVKCWYRCHWRRRHLPDDKTPE